MPPVRSAHHHLQQQARFSHNLYRGAPTNTQQFQWHGGELLLFSFLLNSSEKSCPLVCLCSCYCPVACHLDLKYQENDQCRDNRNGPKSLCMVWAAGDFPQA